GKLLVSNLWNAIDAAVIRVLVVTDAEFIVINPEGKSGLSHMSRADGERFWRYPWESVVDFHVERKATTALISWTAEGKAQTWEADIRANRQMVGLIPGLFLAVATKNRPY
ncbi:hypothetical protein, partial [Actinotignum sp. GS-2025b]